MASSPEAQAAAMLAAMPEKTGKSMAQWTDTISRAKATRHGEIVKLLKSEYGVTHGYANLIAHQFLNAGEHLPSNEALVDAQYAGKETLRPVYEALRQRISAFGDDVEFSPKKSYVSVRRSKQFALIQPSTRTRVDIGIQNKDRNPEGRLEDSGKWNTMVSHRVRVGSPEEVDDELIEWLYEAYQKA